jgi:hypothetical protein
VRAGLLLLGKDLRILRRSPVLLAVLVTYPLVIAALVGLVAQYASAKPRVALVDQDGLPPVVMVAGHTFDVDRTIGAIARNVHLIRGLSADEAARQLREGRIVASITVPPGFVAELETTVRQPELIYRATQGGITPRVQQQVQALVYSLNQLLQKAFIDANLRYVKLILHGGSGDSLDLRFDVLGLDRTEQLLARMPPDERVRTIRNFVHVARLALARSGDALQATANPIRLVQPPERGRTWVLSAQVQSYGIALTITFLTLLLAAGSSAAERDENAIGRLGRGLVSLGQLVWAKIGLAAIVALFLGGSLALVFGIAIEAGGVVGGEPWRRLPLLGLGILLAGAALGAIGTLIGVVSREARTASLVAVLVVMPVVFVGLVPREIVPAAGWISDGLPFVHAVRFFSSALYDPSPWAALGRETLWLCGLGSAFGLCARLGARRLAA